MTPSTADAPSDSIFAVMSDNRPIHHGGNSNNSNTGIPLLGMLIDRTSFDETDDFGVDQTVIRLRAQEYAAAAPPVVMRDGRVRRRLRWRPKHMAKRKRQQQQLQQQQLQLQHQHHRTNSSASVVSSRSNSSRQSKKSMHSFASTETASINNTSKKQQMHGSSKVPLPRPSYPKHGASEVATIGNEADFVHARMTADGMAFAAADSIPSKSKSPTRRPGLPPLFRATNNGNSSSISSSRKEATSVSTPTTEMSQSENDEDSSTLTTEIDTAPAVPVPVLSGDEDDDRRVDLRIRRSATSASGGSSSAPIGPNRSDEERQDRNRRNVLRGVFSEMGKKRSRAPSAELRFSMSSKDPTDAGQDAAASTSVEVPASTDSPPHRTCPVDVDNGTFLEAEKNLQAIHDMATEHLEQGEYAEALEVFEEILRGQLARYGEDHYRVGTALHNIGIVYMRRGDYARALEVYKEAVRVRKMALDPFHPDVAVSLAQLGVAYMESGKHRKAIGAFREALKIRRKSLGNEHPKVAKILNNIGCSLFELDELEVAKVAFEEALDIQRNLLRNPPSEIVSEKLMLSIASTQSNIASIKLYCGQFDAACVDLEEALLIQQCVLGDDHPLAKRTHESLAWMERSRDGALLDRSAVLTGLASAAATKEKSSAVTGGSSRALRLLDTLYSGLDLACQGWDVADEEDYSSSDGESKDFSSNE
jgi:Tetratricopeptide repeat